MLFLALLPLTRTMNMYSTNEGIFENRGKTGAPLFHRDLNRLCLKGKGCYYTWPHCPSLWQCKTTQSLWFQWEKKYPGETTLSSLWITLWDPLFWSCITAITDESVGSSQLKSYCDEESVKACNKEHVVPTCSAQVGPAALLICRTKSRLHSHQEMWQVQIYLILILRQIFLVLEPGWPMSGDVLSYSSTNYGEWLLVSSDQKGWRPLLVQLSGAWAKKWAGRLFTLRAKPVPVETPCARHNQGD